MGMAASQARYLALVARQSNCEYEGQQINQARLNLSNQSANLFNQMLGLAVPVPPSVADYTKPQYSFTDGYNESVIDSWNQLAHPDDDGYNYVVNYHYEANVYRGFEKKMNDPQIQFSYTVPVDTDPTAQRAAVNAIYNAQKALAEAEDDYAKAKEKYESWKAKCAQQVTYRDSDTMKNKAQLTDHTTNGYNVFDNTDRTSASQRNEYLAYSLIGENATLGTASLWADSDGYIHKAYGTNGDGTSYTAVKPGTKLYLESDDYSATAKLTINSTRDESGTEKANFELTSGYKGYYLCGADGSYNVKQTLGASDIPLVYGTEAQKQQISDYLQMWEANGVIIDPSQIYYDLTHDTIALKSDLDSLSGVDDGLMKTLYLYHPTGDHTVDDDYQSIKSANDHLAAYKTDAENAYAAVKAAESDLEALNMPTYAGNSKLTSLGSLTQDQMAEIRQIISDMAAGGVDCNFTKCFSSSLSLDADNYIGGIYTFERDGVTYYTTYYDLANTAAASQFTNAIDNQPKLNYYYATYVKENIYKTDKAVLDTDSRGRFKSVRFKDDGSTYTLNFEQITDDEAYQDAMNQYYYKNAQYDKMIQDINAKTSVIQAEDQQLELRLKQLDTERNALTNEIEAVSKVVKENVEKSFKTFSN